MTNIVIETGRLTADPELRYTGETPLCKFRIAVDRPKKKGAEKPETDFFNCTAWNHNAEFINDMFSKGEMITVVGNLRSSTFEKNGEKRSSVEIKVNEVHFPGTRRNWTIETPEHSYSFTYWQDNWIMTDENGNTVDSFPPFSTLKDDEEPEVPQGKHIDDDGNGSPRVIGKVSGGTETTSEGGSSADSEVTPDTASSGSESRSGASESNPMPIIAGVAIAAGVGVGGYFMMKKKK